MTEFFDWVISWLKTYKELICFVSSILGIVGFVIAPFIWLIKRSRRRCMNSKDKKSSRLNARRDLITILEKVFALDAKDSGKRFMGAFYDLKENGIAIRCDAKHDEKMRYFIGLKTFIAELEKGCSIQGLDSEEEVRKFVDV